MLITRDKNCPSWLIVVPSVANFYHFDAKVQFFKNVFETEKYAIYIWLLLEKLKVGKTDRASVVKNPQYLYCSTEGTSWIDNTWIGLLI